MSLTATVVLDGHVHLYPVYSLPAALGTLFANLSRHVPESDGPVVRVGLLTDTAAARSYRDRIAQSRPKQVDRFILQPTDEPGAMAVREEDRLLGYLVAGRQIVTAERLEVLALTVDLDLPDGRPLTETLTAIRDAGGLPVLSWSPGKWSGPRGQLVRDTLATSGAPAVWLGDTSMRPQGTAEPALIRDARAKGLRVLHGTDALPFAGEESRLGTWASRLRGPWDAATPVTSLRALLSSADIPIAPVGVRLAWPRCALLWTRLMLRKYARRP